MSTTVRIVGRKIDANAFMRHAVAKNWEALSDVEFGKVVVVGDREYGARVELSSSTKRAQVKRVDFFKIREIRPRRLIRVADPRISLPESVYSMFVSELDDISTASSSEGGLSRLAR